MALTEVQIGIVKQTAPLLQEHGTTVTSIFYRNLLSARPDMKKIFNLNNQQTGLQQNALAKSVLAYATYINQLGQLGSVAERIAQKHASLFIKPEQYPIIGEHLVGAFAQVLQDAFTTEVKEAWIAAYGQLADLLIQREGQLYSEAGDWQSWRKFRITNKVPENEYITSFHLQPADGHGLPPFRPGQYVSLQIPVPGIQGMVQSRQYSLSEAPTPGMTHYCISVKKERTVAEASVEDKAQGKVPGIISNLLHDEYSVGDEVELSPPRGEFFVDASDASKADNPLILLSAGVGAAPLRAILDAILANPAQRRRPVTWMHTARRSASICFGQHVRNAASKHDNLKAMIFVRDLCDSDVRDVEYDFHGTLPPVPGSKDGTTSLCLDNKNAEYYICGPEAWMLELSLWLESNGVGLERQHLELFRPGSLR